MTTTTVGCGRCGASVVDPSAAFCAACGTSLSDRPAPPPFPPPSASVPPAPPWYGGVPAQPYQMPRPPVNGWGPPPVANWSAPGGWQSAPPASDGLGIASLVLSLVWLMGLGSIAAVVLGHLARSKAKRAGREASGISLAGLIIGYIGTVGTAGLIALAVVGASAAQSRLAGQASLRSDLKNASIAEESFATDNNGAYTTDLDALAASGLVVTPGDTVDVLDVHGQYYCLEATSSRTGARWYLSSDTFSPSPFACG